MKTYRQLHSDGLEDDEALGQLHLIFIITAIHSHLSLSLGDQAREKDMMWDEWSESSSKNWRGAGNKMNKRY